MEKRTNGISKEVYLKRELELVHFNRLQEEHSEPTINLTPLIDVVFVILIIFIVIAPLLELDQIALAESGKSHDKSCLSTEKCGPIAIYVRADNSLWFENRRVNLQELPLFFAKAHQKFPSATPQIFHDKNATFGTYQTIKNAAEQAGFKQMDVVLKP